MFFCEPLLLYMSDFESAFRHELSSNLGLLCIRVGCKPTVHNSQLELK